MNNWKKCSISSFSVGALTILLGTILGGFVFPSAFDRIIDKRLVVRNGSVGWPHWVNMPQMEFKVYIFNITNVKDVKRGHKPILVEQGPYIYKHLINKYDIEIGKDTLSYYRHHNLIFDKEQSYPLTEDDKIVVTHLHLMSTILYVEMANPGSMAILNRVIKTLFNNPKDIFLRTTVREFLFDGVPGNCSSEDVMVKIVCDKLRQENSDSIKFEDDGTVKFLAMGGMNNTHDGRYTTWSGARDIRDRGRIVSWENYTGSIETWEANSTCNKISGTDGSIHRPHLSRRSKIEIFVPHLCRSIPLHYKQDVIFRKLHGYRYENEMVFASPSVNPDNQCFCTRETKGIVGKDGCLLNGAMELARCRVAPLVVTNPHFMNTDAQYKEGVGGLLPDYESHSSFVELEHITGATLRANMRLQFNLFIRSVNNINVTNNLKTTLMPIFWIDEQFRLPYEYTVLVLELYHYMNIAKLVIGLIIGIGFSMLLTGLAALYAHRCVSSHGSEDLTPTIPESIELPRRN